MAKKSAASLGQPETIQTDLFRIDPDEDEVWFQEWNDMPEYAHDDLMPWRSVLVHFRNREDFEDFQAKIGQLMAIKGNGKVQKSIWHPKLEIERCIGVRRYVDQDQIDAGIADEGDWPGHQEAEQSRDEDDGEEELIREVLGKDE